MMRKSMGMMTLTSLVLDRRNLTSANHGDWMMRNWIQATMKVAMTSMALQWTRTEWIIPNR
ncbi:hypothetical protein I7I51_08762 [Histoplasma capsulatum]|uniref:Uncharacterized protein n=1 Tax=Ajellomyces capsulatus TaxID=5037 RepID=A0A8A1M554_AJECA|nr:hypothetical protein I7I51_08762 [Histoplasma capsulatum]